MASCSHGHCKVLHSQAGCMNNSIHTSRNLQMGGALPSGASIVLVECGKATLHAGGLRLSTAEYTVDTQGLHAYIRLPPRLL